MNKTNVICLQCPFACNMEVTLKESREIQEISNHICKKGAEYAEEEIKNPVRVLTTTVEVQSETFQLLPVQTSKPVSKEKLFDCMSELAKVKVQSPIGYNEVILENILGTGVDVIATMEIKR